MLPRKRSIILPIVTILSLIKISEQHGSGAPPGACIDQLPRHESIQPQGSTTPYVILTSASQVRQGQLLDVTIDGLPGAPIPIGGFILQAREIQNPDRILGTFTKVPYPENTKIISCRGDNDTVTHSTPQEKPALTFQWRAPTDFLGSFEFRATVAQSYAMFWKNVASSLVEVVSNDTEIVSTPASRTTPRMTALPPVILESKPTARPEVLDMIYQGCGDTKLCFGDKETCVENENCNAVVAVFVDGETYTFEIQGAGNSIKYVAAGLSEDDKMGDDSAMECVNIDGKVKIYSSWTYPKEKPYVTRNVYQTDILKPISSSFIDGKIYCKFTRQPVTTPMRYREINLITKQYNLMIVAGTAMNDNVTVGFHDIIYKSMGSPIFLSEVGIVGSSSRLLIQLHGCIMVFAWMMASTVGIFFARYYRQTWVGKKIFGLDVWFVFHRSLMQLTWLATMVAFVLIAVHAKGWVKPADNAHAITGIITVVLCFIQPLGAFFRPHPGTKRRPIFNWTHFAIGNLAYLFALITMFLAINLTKAEMPRWTVYIISAFIIYHVAMHVAITCTVCMKGSNYDMNHMNRVNAFPMKEMKGSPRPLTEMLHVDLDAPHPKFRKFVLALYIIGSALFTIAVICIIVIDFPLS